MARRRLKSTSSRHNVAPEIRYDAFVSSFSRFRVGADVADVAFDEPTERLLASTDFSRSTSVAIADTARAMTDGLLAGGTRAKLDDRDNYTPGWKYNHWELKGVPLRVEFGPRDMEAGHCVVVRRDTGAKETVRLDALTQRAAAMCEEMQADMLARATQRRNESVVTVTSWDGFVEALDECKMVLTPWCETKESEELVKKRTQGESEGGGQDAVHPVHAAAPLAGDEVLRHRRARHHLGALGQELLREPHARRDARRRATKNKKSERLAFRHDEHPETLECV